MISLTPSQSSVMCAIFLVWNWNSYRVDSTNDTKGGVGVFFLPLGKLFPWSLLSSFVTSIFSFLISFLQFLGLQRWKVCNCTLHESDLFPSEILFVLIFWICSWETETTHCLELKQQFWRDFLWHSLCVYPLVRNQSAKYASWCILP